jgi:hypothetical protein
MKPDAIAAAVAIISVSGAVFNSWIFWRLRAALLEIRVTLLESEKRVLDEVEDKYVRKDSFRSLARA